MTLLAILLSHQGKRSLNSSRIFASAFTSSSLTSSSTSTVTAFTSSKSRRSFGAGPQKCQFFSTNTDSSPKTATTLSATVEDELDSALDDILGSAFEEAGDLSKKASNIKVQSVSNNDSDVDDGVSTEVRLYHMLLLLFTVWIIV